MAFEFGDFVLDTDTRQLLRRGDEIHVSPKSFELLITLVVNRPRAVSKGELIERLWPSTFVEESNLAGLAAELRRALGDSASDPAFIRTVYRFGYRFIGDVVERGSTPRAAVEAGPRPRIVFENRQVVLIDGPNVIGRAADATIQCDVAGVSRHHARIVVVNGEAVLEDLESKNGTFLRRQRITSARLEDGDEIRLGRALLIYRDEPTLGPTETVGPDSRTG